ncbi:MAG: hypothetical protein SFY80_06115 [Verrucomicrobiota bacterium]|nr:hypothetical protein [Verrucomicrobiota bacterium]
MPKETAKKIATSKKSAPIVEPIKAATPAKPATKAVKVAPVAAPAPVKKAKAPATKTAALATKPSVTAAKPATTAPAAVAAPATATPVAPTACACAQSKTCATTIVVNYDAGFGNSLFLRGEGTGLSWDKGVEMQNLNSEEWMYTVQGATSTLAVKVLVNDSLWSSGANVEVPAGQKTVITPVF